MSKLAHFSDMETSEQLNRELESLYRRTGHATGGTYWPSYFLRAVRQHGGLAVAKKLLSSRGKSTGFDRMAEAGRADLSVEAIALDARFSHLFTDEERKLARERLDSLPPEAFPVDAGPPAGRLAEELPNGEGYLEGSAISVLLNRYERDPQARAACLKFFGTTCQVCDLNFTERYGEIGEGFMHVHHRRPLHSIGPNYRVNPKLDLVPVCPNCHAMLHRKNPPLDVEQLKALLIRA